MSASWNWRIVEFAASHAEWVSSLFGKPTHDWAIVCRKKNCGKKSECYVAYDYITGRQGRVSSNEKPYCREHANEIIGKKQREAA